jgi:hypothetical protein
MEEDFDGAFGEDVRFKYEENSPSKSDCMVSILAYKHQFIFFDSNIWKFGNNKRPFTNNLAEGSPQMMKTTQKRTRMLRNSRL